MKCRAEVTWVDGFWLDSGCPHVITAVYESGEFRRMRFGIFKDTLRSQTAEEKAAIK